MSKYTEKDNFIEIMESIKENQVSNIEINLPNSSLPSSTLDSIKVDVADDFPHYKISKNFLVHILRHIRSHVLARVWNRYKIACGPG